MSLFAECSEQQSHDELTSQLQQSHKDEVTKLQKKISKLKFDLQRSADLLGKHELNIPHSDDRPISPIPNVINSMQQTIDSQAAQIQRLNNRLSHNRAPPRTTHSNTISKQPSLQKLPQSVSEEKKSDHPFIDIEVILQDRLAEQEDAFRVRIEDVEDSYEQELEICRRENVRAKKEYQEKLKALKDR